MTAKTSLPTLYYADAKAQETAIGPWLRQHGWED